MLIEMPDGSYLDHKIVLAVKAHPKRPVSPNSEIFHLPCVSVAYDITKVKYVNTIGTHSYTLSTDEAATNWKDAIVLAVNRAYSMELDYED